LNESVNGGTCPGGWTLYNNYCYRAFNGNGDSVTQATAVSQCPKKHNGASLVSIDDKNEAQFVDGIS
jgi:hypothetical protein